MKTNWGGTGAVAAGVVAVLALSHAGATTFWTTPYKPDLMASWVQAVGSIAAIAGAIFAVHIQRKHQNDAESRRQTRELEQLAAAVKLIAEDARAAIIESTQAIQAHNNSSIFNAPTDRLEDAQYALRTLLEKALPSKLLVSIIILQRQVTYSLRALKQRNGVSTSINEGSKGRAGGRTHTANDACDKISEFISFPWDN